MMIAPLQASDDAQSGDAVPATLAYLRQTVPAIAGTLDAIISVNRARMSAQQSNDLAAVRNALDGVLHELALTETGADTRKSYQDGLASLAKAKQLLTKAAAEF